MGALYSQNKSFWGVQMDEEKIRVKFLRDRGYDERGNPLQPKRKRGRPRKPGPDPIALQTARAKLIVGLLAKMDHRVRVSEKWAMKYFKEQVRWNLHRRDMNHGTLAKSMGISLSNLSHKLNNPRTRIRSICWVAAAMGRSVEITLVPFSRPVDGEMLPVWVRPVEDEYESFYQIKNGYESRGPGELEKWLESEE